MERNIFGEKILYNKRPWTDRFIPQRTYVEEQKRRPFLHHLSHEEDRDDNWCSDYLHQKRYASRLNDEFGLKALRYPYRSNDQTSSHFWRMDCAQHWPCVPRTKSYFSSADSGLAVDLPSYREAQFPDLLDWGSEDMLVVALGTKYYKWIWRTQELVGRGQTWRTVFCCKFDPRAKLLALGSGRKTVEIHDNERTKCLIQSSCFCLRFSCSITAVDWSPTGNSYVIGCSRGYLCSFERNYAKLVSWRRAFLQEILFVRVSPNARFVACTSVGVKHVEVFEWPSLRPYVTVDSEGIVRSITWHPWRSALLAVGAIASDQHTTISLWDVPACKMRQVTVSPGRVILDTMLFSHRTGELVLSLSNLDISARLEEDNGSRFVVLSDPDTVVDQWGEGRQLDRVRTMVFSPDGTKLGSATADEALNIWRFLPEEKGGAKRANPNRRFSALPVYLDKSKYEFSLR